MTRIIRVAAIALFLGAFCAPRTLAQTSINAASCAETDVAAAVALATNGDTVVIPSCNSTTPGGINTWTSTLFVNVDITFQGQGIGNTVLIDNISKGNNTCGGAAPMLSFTVTNAAETRITSFTIQGNAADTFVCQPGHVQLNGTSSQVRFDHILMSQKTAGVRMGGCVYGVADHDTFNASFKQAFIVDHGGCGGDFYGDYNWSVATGLGGPNFWFIEDCTFNDPTPVGAGAFDMEEGAKVVLRHSTLSFTAGHGTESSQRGRSMRAFEIYDNSFTATEPAQSEGFLARGGTGVVWGNNFQDNGANVYNGFIALALFRDADAFPPWGGPAGSGNAGACDGVEPYDTNGTVQASGTVTTGGNRTFTDTSKNFAVNQFAGGSFTIRDVTRGLGYLIASNTANTIVAVPDIGYGQPGTFAAGDSYQILTAYPCIDQVGRGPGALLSNYVPTPAAPVNEALEPVYQWNNTHNGMSGSVKASSSSSRILINRDYYDNTMLSGYTPYQYPHPLVMSTPAGNPPSTPSYTVH